MKFAKKFICFLIIVVSLLTYSSIAVSAANEYYYKGCNITYNDGEGYYVGYKTWNGGFLWLSKYKEKYYMTNSYMRCVTYYHNSWIANQGQTLTIASSKTISRSVTSGVSAEVGIEGVVSANLGVSHTASVTTEYSSSLGLSYDLSKFSHNSYRIAAMGYYDKFNVKKYKNGTYQSSKNLFAYDADFGQEIRLVYRY